MEDKAGTRQGKGRTIIMKRVLRLNHERLAGLTDNERKEGQP